METIIGKSFKDQDVVIDDRCYVNCKFKNCKIIFTGGDHSLVDVQFENCQIMITGLASKTLQFLHAVGVLPQAAVPMPQLPDAGALH